MLQALIIKRDQIEYAKTRAILQAVVNHEKAQEALDAYRDLALPYFQRAQQNQRAEYIKRLLSEVQQGPIQVTPMVEPKIRSQLKTRVVDRTELQTNEGAWQTARKPRGIR